MKLKLLVSLLIIFSSCKLHKTIHINEKAQFNEFQAEVYLHSRKNPTYKLKDWQYDRQNFSGKFVEVEEDSYEKYYRSFKNSNNVYDAIHLYLKKDCMAKSKTWNTVDINNVKRIEYFNKNFYGLFGKRKIRKLNNKLTYTRFEDDIMVQLKNPIISQIGIKGTLTSIPEEELVDKRIQKRVTYIHVPSLKFSHSMLNQQWNLPLHKLEYIETRVPNFKAQFTFTTSLIFFFSAINLGILHEEGYSLSGS